MKKKLLRIFFAFIMFFSVLPTAHIPTKVNAANITGGKILFLDTNIWNTGGARFSAYFYNNSSNKWVDCMSDGRYCSVVAPSGTWTNVIFCRMNSAYSDNSWDADGKDYVWNQTGDLTFDGSKDLFTISSWDNQTSGWSTLSNKGNLNNLYLEPNSEWKTDNARFAVYTKIGNYPIFIDMADSDGDGFYKTSTYTGSLVIFCRMNPSTTANNWNNKWNQTGDLTYTSSNNCYTMTAGSWDSGNWGPSSFNISYNLDNGSVSPENPTSYTLDDNEIILNNPTRNGYTFAGWTGSNGNTPETSVTISKTSTGVLSYTANWTANNYTVTFNPNGDGASTPTASKSVTYNSTYGDLPTPTRTGYTFAGWYTAPSGGTKVTSSTTVSITSGQTLYAHWTANTYSVVYDANGGTGTMENSSHTYGTPSSLRANTFTLTGYSFSGWNTADNGTGIFYSNQQSVSTLTPTDGEIVTLYAQWTANTYTITFDNQGADISSGTTSMEVTYDSILPDITPPEKTGYKFNGYYGSVGGTGGKYYNQGGDPYSDKIYEHESNIILYAKWTAYEYIVSFDVNGGNSVHENIEIAYDSPYGTLPTPTHSDSSYIFTGWFTEAEGGTQIHDISTVKIANDHTLYAHWDQLEIYTVTLNPNGNGASVTPSSIQIYETLRYGYITSLPTPTRNGYSFTGWYSDAKNGTMVDDYTTVLQNANHTLYAHWSANEYTIIFEENGGSTVENITQAFETPVLKPSDPTKTGYTFTGWYSDEDCTQEYTFTTMPLNGITLYAGWEANTYTVTLNTQGGTSKDPLIVTYDSTYVGLTNASGKTGYEFVGWFTEAEGGIQITKNSTVNITENQILYAHWRSKEYTLTLNHNYGETPTTQEITVTYDQLIPTVIPPTRDGYTFLGYYTNAGGGTKKIDSNGVGLANWTTAGNTTIYYAHWEPIQYNINYNLNGGVLDIDNPISYDIESETFTLNNPTRDGYIFAGWTGSNSNTPQLEVSIELGTFGDLSYAANWTPITYNISYNLNGGSVAGNPTTYNIETNSFTLKNPTKTGYDFIGWTGSNGNVPQTTITISKGTFEDLSYTANWEAHEYTITYNIQMENVTHSNPNTYTVEDASFTLINPEKYGAEFIGWTIGSSTTPSTSLTIDTSQAKDLTITAHWRGTITFHIDNEDYQNATSTWGWKAKESLYVFGTSGNYHSISWDVSDYDKVNSQTRFTYDSDKNEHTYVVTLSTIAYEDDKKFVDITGVIFYFFEDKDYQRYFQRTFNLEIDLDINDVGGHYELVMPNSFTGHNDSSDNNIWKIDNITIAKMTCVTYMLPDGITIIGEDYYTAPKAKYRPIFVEKEGFKLDGWYTDTNLTSKFESGVATLDENGLTLYAKYIEVDDFYLYIDAREVINGTGIAQWTPTHVYLWSDYFVTHNNGAWPGDDDTNNVVNLGNGMFQIKVDASKSYDHLILNNGGTKKTEDIDLSPDNVYYIINSENTLDNDQYKFTTTAEEHLDNLMGVQKVSGTNNFRFSAALPTGLNIDNNVSKNFGYKFIFIKEDNSSYIGYWSFSTSNKLDALRLDELYKSTALDPESAYDGFYALTLKSSASFDYRDYVRVVVVACYKENNSNNTNVIKAQEYIINVDGDNITLTQVNR